MKQLSALGARRHFFRNPRRMRALRAGMSPNDLDDGDMMAGPGFGYFSGNSSMANLISDRRIRGEKNSINVFTYSRPIIIMRFHSSTNDLVKSRKKSKIVFKKC